MFLNPNPTAEFVQAMNEAGINLKSIEDLVDLLDTATKNDYPRVNLRVDVVLTALDNFNKLTLYVGKTALNSGDLVQQLTRERDCLLTDRLKGYTPYYDVPPYQEPFPWDVTQPQPYQDGDFEDEMRKALRGYFTSTQNTLPNYTTKLGMRVSMEGLGYCPQRLLRWDKTLNRGEGDWVDLEHDVLQHFFYYLKPARYAEMMARMQ